MERLVRRSLQARSKLEEDSESEQSVDLNNWFDSEQNVDTFKAIVAKVFQDEISRQIEKRVAESLQDVVKEAIGDEQVSS